MGFAKENTEAISYFKANHYKLLETSYPYVFHFKNYKPLSCSDKIIEINSDNYDLFEKLHKAVDGDMYWNTERILKNLHNWHIYYYDDGATQAAIYFTGKKVQEIFGVDFSSDFNPDAFRRLIEKCLNVCHSHGAEHMYYFSENNEAIILSKLDFNSLGEYNLYILCLT